MGPQHIAVTNFDSIDKLLGLPAYTATPMLVQVNERLEKSLEHLVNLWHREAFLNDGSKLNESIFKVAPTTYWRGPMVAVAQIGQDLNPTQHRDVTPADFRNLVDHFVLYADRIGMGADSVAEDDLPEPKMEMLDGEEVQARYSESVMARLARFQKLMQTGDVEVALKVMPREQGDEESFATLQRLVDMVKVKQAKRDKEMKE